MTKEQYHRMIYLRGIVMSIYGIEKYKSSNKRLNKLFKEYIKLRRMYSDCNGKWRPSL